MPHSKYPFRNLIFEGGGVKGIAYSGALAVLEQRGILRRIKRVGGASAGAINASLLALDENRLENSGRSSQSVRPRGMRG